MMHRLEEIFAPNGKEEKGSTDRQIGTLRTVPPQYGSNKEPYAALIGVGKKPYL
jgi:hypothetical protein